MIAPAMRSSVTLFWISAEPIAVALSPRRMKIEEKLAMNSRLGTSTRRAPTVSQFGGLDAGDRRDVAGDERQHARREERHRAGCDCGEHADPRGIAAGQHAQNSKSAGRNAVAAVPGRIRPASFLQVLEEQPRKPPALPRDRRGSLVLDLEARTGNRLRVCARDGERVLGVGLVAAADDDRGRVQALERRPALERSRARHGGERVGDGQRVCVRARSAGAGLARPARATRVRAARGRRPR